MQETPARISHVLGGGEENKKRLTFLRPAAALESAKDYFASSFFGLHLVQVLPSLAAFTQQACSQVLPAAFAFSQQLSARAMLTEPKNARAQATAMNDLIAFICFTFFLPVTQTGGCFRFQFPEATQLPGIWSGRIERQYIRGVPLVDSEVDGGMAQSRETALRLCRAHVGFRKH
jgi:hypothetical protein